MIVIKRDCKGLIGLSGGKMATQAFARGAIFRQGVSFRLQMLDDKPDSAVAIFELEGYSIILPASAIGRVESQ